MRRSAWVLAFAVAGYLLGAVLGYAGVLLLSRNQHDMELEAAMTSVFVWGPGGAIVAAIVGWVRSAKGRASAPGD